MRLKSQYPWEAVFQDAVSDLNSTELPSKIAAARALIDARVQELIVERHPKERIAVIDALFALHCAEQYQKNQSLSERPLRAVS